MMFDLGKWMESMIKDQFTKHIEKQALLKQTLYDF